jgi:hypothetical protein
MWTKRGPMHGCLWVRCATSQTLRGKVDSAAAPRQ